MSETSQERNESRPGDGDAVMIYFNPELLQTIAVKSAQRRRDFEELLSSAEEGDLDAAYRLARACLERFKEKDGAVLCRDLKGLDTGTVLRPCPECISDAVEIIAELLYSE